MSDELKKAIEKEFMSIESSVLSLKLYAEIKEEMKNQLKNKNLPTKSHL